MHLAAPVEHDPLDLEPPRYLDSCTAVPELEEHCPSYLSFVASVAEGTEDSAAQPQSFVYRMAYTVTVVAVKIVHRVRGCSQVAARQYKSFLLSQERLEHSSLT